MKIIELVNEVFDITKAKEAAEIQRSIANLNTLAAKNPDFGKGIADDASKINANFQTILATLMAQQRQSLEDEKKKKAEEAIKAKVTNQSGVGSKVPIGGGVGPTGVASGGNAPGLSGQGPQTR